MTAVDIPVTHGTNQLQLQRDTQVTQQKCVAHAWAHKIQTLRVLACVIRGIITELLDHCQ